MFQYFYNKFDFILRGEPAAEPDQAFYKDLLLKTERENSVLKLKLKEQEFLLERLQAKKDNDSWWRARETKIFLQKRPVFT